MFFSVILVDLPAPLAATVRFHLELKKKKMKFSSAILNNRYFKPVIDTMTWYLVNNFQVQLTFEYYSSLPNKTAKGTQFKTKETHVHRDLKQL